MVRAIRVEEKGWILEVPRERIEELARRIKPVVRLMRIRRSTKLDGDGGIVITEREHPRGKWRPTWSEKGDLYYIKPVDLFDIAYTWEPMPAEMATSLKFLCDIKTYHTYGYYGFFKPSIAEVLAQIPMEYLDKVVAFEIVESPQTADDLNREREALDAGYHVAVTRLYVREQQ